MFATYHSIKLLIQLKTPKNLDTKKTLSKLDSISLTELNSMPITNKQMAKTKLFFVLNPTKDIYISGGA